MNSLLAYLDPGSGSLLLQGLVGGVASALVMGKVYWREPSGSWLWARRARRRVASRLRTAGRSATRRPGLPARRARSSAALTEEGLADWEAFAASGLLERFVESGDVVETRAANRGALEASARAEPEGELGRCAPHERIPFVSYPYEWTFSMLKDAALLQLRITREALAADLALKDATPYNVQWRGARPVFIDVGSFERARPGEPWLGYRQFCMLFLYPLLLEAYRGIPFQPWLRGSLEGIHPSRGAGASPRAGHPPRRRVQARRPSREARAQPCGRRRRTSGASCARPVSTRSSIEANLKGLEKLVSGLSRSCGPTEWSDYGDDLQLLRRGHAGEGGVRPRRGSPAAAVARLGSRRERRPVLPDRGGGSGLHHRPRRRPRRRRPALPRACKSEGCSTILPLVGDIADPSPALGWRGRERLTLWRSVVAGPRARAGARPPPDHRPHDPAAGARRLARRARQRARRRVPRPRRRDGQAAALAQARRLASRLHTRRPSRTRSAPVSRSSPARELPSGTRAIYHAAPH